MLPNRMNDVVRSILAAGVAALVATAATLTTLTATTATITSLVAANATSTTMVAGSMRVNATNGAISDGAFRATLSVNPQSIAAGGSTTTVVTVTGASAGDHCSVNATDGDLWSTTSTVVLSCRAGSNIATVNYYNATSTAAFDAGASTLSVKVDSY